jgi:hypothetical protein
VNISRIIKERLLGSKGPSIIDKAPEGLYVRIDYMAFDGKTLQLLNGSHVIKTYDIRFVPGTW